MTPAALDWLRAARAHVLGTVEGLDEDALRRPVLPSGWTCLGMVRHLTMDVEVFWFQAVVAGDAAAAERLDGAWTPPPDLPASAVLDAYRAAAERADEIVAAADPADPPAWWPGELFGDYRLADVREVVQHVILETATHAGHLDAARELLDGRPWLVLT